MNDEYNLSRFISAHERDYSKALSEIKSGYKQSHWMWYIFPQIAGLGLSSTSQYYSISGAEEAKAFLSDPILGAHLNEICNALLSLSTSNAHQVFGWPDDMKLKSSMTLFSSVSQSNSVFDKVLEKFFNGEKDDRTLRLL